MHQPNNASAVPRLRVGSLFSGYGGLDLAVEHALNAETIWFSENNEAVARVFGHHWPDAPNLGDITTIDWRAVRQSMCCAAASNARTYRRWASRPASRPAPDPGSGRTWPPQSTRYNLSSS